MLGSEIGSAGFADNAAHGRTSVRMRGYQLGHQTLRLDTVLAARGVASGSRPWAGLPLIFLRHKRLLNHASWDTFAAMGVVRRFAVTGLEEAARRRRRRRGLVIGAIDETGQEKAGEATAGVKRQYLGCAGQVANGINTVHVAYVRERTGHALIGARQWIPREQIEDPVKSLLMGLPLDLGFRTKGQLAIDISTDAAADGIRPDFYCGDEVYGNCTQLREHFEAERQAYVLRVPSNFMLTLAAGTKLTCAEAVKALLKHPRRWEVRSAGGGSKGERWYAWAWLATASARHHLLVRRHLKTGELAFHYCFVPEGQLLTKTRLIRAAGLRWPIEEDFEFSKDCFGLDQCQARLYTAIARHAVLVMAALAICAITSALLLDRSAHAAAFDLPAPYGTVSSGAAANGSDHAPPKTASIRGTSQSPLRLCARSGFTCTIVIRH